ncbi:MAG TPA: hypothetical protein V6D09_17105 [Leptolyngbyaceae cyanobacterium]
MVAATGLSDRSSIVRLTRYQAQPDNEIVLMLYISAINAFSLEQ